MSFLPGRLPHGAVSFPKSPPYFSFCQKSEVYRRELTAWFRDASGQGAFIHTSFHIKYYSRGLIFYRLRYEGSVDQDLVSIEDDMLGVNIGGLPIDGDYLDAGERINVVFSVKRASGSRDLSLSWDEYHRLP